MLYSLLSGVCLAALAAVPSFAQQNTTFGTDFAVSFEDLPATRGEYTSPIWYTPS